MLNFKKDLKVGKSQDGSKKWPIFNCLKGPLGGLCPFETCILHALDQVSHNGAKVFDELVVEGC